MFSKSKPKPSLDEVRKKLILFTHEAKEKAQRQAEEEGEFFNQKTGELSLVFLSWDPHDLVPSARQIITTEVAQQVIGFSGEGKALYGQDALSTIPVEDVDLYLRVLLFTLESFVSLTEDDLDLLRRQISTNGSVFHQTRAAQYHEAKRWENAEDEFRLGLSFDELYPMAGNIVCTLSNLGRIVWNQGRKEEARQLFNRALSEFAEVPASATSYIPAMESVQFIEKNRNIIFE